MMRACLLAFLTVTACTEASAPDTTPERTRLAPGEIRSGYTFLQPQTQALQDDDFANPGFLWVDRGDALFHEAAANGKSCASCHGEEGEELASAAAHYPAIDEDSGELVNIEGRINLCRARHQEREPLDYESDDLLGLTAYVAYLARGVPMSVDISGAAQSWYEKGEDYFYTRRGQFNLACSQCHNESWGKKLRGDTISQGHGNAFPGYRLEWQSFGSLQRRLRDCDSGVRAEPLDYGSDTYKAVELYLAKRAEGLAMESPGVRR
ncbi:sulfur oxidation c-type cytochrome SoxA [Henriciella aquimarina]|uniref:sulfur oxidation c-type cytochrome SoxA n=1 Tax=Henriciella aquimarina TaxID=545261 RepID=UPI000A027839|nr:sulfur oxidation c-type cytochrome SoxA [Henriciella aquimarina]